MWAPKPMTLSRTCSWKPVTMETDRIMTATPSMTLRIPSLTMGLEKLALDFRNIRLAMKNSNFNADFLQKYEN